VTDSVEIRALQEEEFPAVLALMCAAFGEEATEEDADAYRQSLPFERSIAAFENGKMVAMSAVLSLELTVPGGVAVPMGGVTWIATLPTHRRRGLLRRLMTVQFADMVERGETVAGLGASEGNIYGRFGFGPAASVMTFSVERAYGAFANPIDETASGHFTLLNALEAATRLPPIYESLRLRQPGAVSRQPGMWREHLADPPVERAGATRMFHVVHETTPGTADGYVSYRVKEDWQGATSMNEARVVQLLAANPDVYKALWNFVLNTDLCRTVSCERGRVDEPLRWLLADPRRFKVGELFDFLWLRLLDAPRALAARAYASVGKLALEVTDLFPTPSVARFLLCSEQANALGAECAPTTSAPDLALGIDALAAAYLGGVTFATLAAAGRVREKTAGAVELADAMFSTGSAPYCMTQF
jgi:predicted acetyltransferase